MKQCLVFMFIWRLSADHSHYRYCLVCFGGGCLFVCLVGFVFSNHKTLGSVKVFFLTPWLTLAFLCLPAFLPGVWVTASLSLWPFPGKQGSGSGPDLLSCSELASGFFPRLFAKFLLSSFWLLSWLSISEVALKIGYKGNTKSLE